MTSGHGSGNYRVAETIGHLRALLEDLREEWKARANIERQREERAQKEAVERALRDDRIDRELQELGDSLKTVQRKIAKLEGVDMPDTGVHETVPALPDKPHRTLLMWILAALTTIGTAIGAMFGGSR